MATSRWLQCHRVAITSHILSALFNCAVQYLSTRQLQCDQPHLQAIEMSLGTRLDQTLPLSAMGVACKTMLIPICLSTAGLTPLQSLSNPSSFTVCREVCHIIELDLKQHRYGSELAVITSTRAYKNRRLE